MLKELNDALLKRGFGRDLAKFLCNQFDFGKELLPIIPPQADLSEGSTIRPESRGKSPGRRGKNGRWYGYAWRTDEVEAEEIDRTGGGIGLRTSLYPCVDIDILDEALADLMAAEVERSFPGARPRVGRSPKRAYILKLRDGEAPFGKIRITLSRDDVESAMEILGDGQQCVLYGIHPGTGLPYSWPNGMVGRNQLPAVKEEDIRGFLARAQRIAEGDGWKCSFDAKGSTPANRHPVDPESLKTKDWALLERIMEFLPNDYDDRGTFINVGIALYAATKDDPVRGFQMFLGWAMKWAGGNDPELVEKEWDGFAKMNNLRIGDQWLCDLARGRGFNNAADEFPAIPGAVAPEVGRNPPNWRTPSGLAQSTWPSIRRADLGSRPILAHLNDLVYQNDSGNAERFKVICGGEVRYCAEQKSWLVFEGRRWVWDDGPLVGEKAEDAMRYFHWEASRGIDSKERLMEFARVSLEGGRMRNMISQAKGKLPVRQDMLDQGDYLLNFTNGTLDLRTLELRPHRAEDFITKMLPFEYSASARCDTFRRVVMEAFAGDMDLFRYFQEALGYSLTGDTREKAAFYCHGPSGGGKSTVLDAVRRALGGYATSIPATALTVRPGYESSTDLTALARLVGARFAYSDEPEEGAALNEHQFKVLVPNGRGVMNTRRLFRDSVESRVTHKHWIGANYLLNTKSGKGIHERLRMIPFTNVVPPERQEEGMPERLDSEWAGIVAFMVEGAHSWYKRGRLLSPRLVEEEGLQYKKSQEPAEAWRASCLEFVQHVKTSSQELQASFDRFRRRTGKPPLTQKKLAEQYTAWGLKPQRMTGGTSGWSGVRILGEFGEEAGPNSADVAEIL